MDGSFKIVVTHQAGKIHHHNGPVEVAEGEPLQLREFGDLEGAKAFCKSLAAVAPYFKCRVYRGAEQVFEQADAEWLKRELERLRAAHAMARRRGVLFASACIGAVLVTTMAFLPGLSVYYGPAMLAFIAFLILLEAIPNVLTTDAKLEQAAELVGTRNPRVARVMYFLGILVGLGLLVLAVHGFLTAPGGR